VAFNWEAGVYRRGKQMQVIERRGEVRYTVAETCDKRLTLKIRRNTGEFTSAELVNVSLRGIRIKYDLGLIIGSVVQCSIYIPKYLTKEVSFSVKVIYCIENREERSFLIGGEIIQTYEQLWVSVFLRVYDFIDKSLRTGKA
jgi:hypothetical protein